MEGQIRRVFGKDADMAIKISWAENGSRKCDRDNKGLNKDGTYDIGVFMINAYYHRHKATDSELRDCLKNILVAKQIFDRQGWSPWVVYANKSYLRYKAN